MGMLILLLCSLPPLALLVVAVTRGLSTGDASAVSALAISAAILIASALLPFAGEPEPLSSLRFTRPEAGAVAAKESGYPPLRLTRRWGQDETIR